MPCFRTRIFRESPVRPWKMLPRIVFFGKTHDMGESKAHLATSHVLVWLSFGEEGELVPVRALSVFHPWPMNRCGLAGMATNAPVERAGSKPKSYEAQCAGNQSEAARCQRALTRQLSCITRRPRRVVQQFDAGRVKANPSSLVECAERLLEGFLADPECFPNRLG